jgi:hypothetical protein
MIDFTVVSDKWLSEMKSRTFNEGDVMLRKIFSVMKGAFWSDKFPRVCIMIMICCSPIIIWKAPAEWGKEPHFPTWQEQEEEQPSTYPANINIGSGSGDQVVVTGEGVVVNHRGTVVTAGRVPTVVINPTTTVHPTITVNGVTVVTSSFTYNPLEVGTSYHCDCETEHYAPLTITGGNYYHRCGTPQRSSYPTDGTITAIYLSGGDYICDCEWGHGGPLTITGGTEICIQ